MPAWVYKSISRPYNEMLTDEQMTKIGELGFELVQVLQIAQEVTVVGKQREVVTLHYIFKRHVPGVAKPQQSAQAQPPAQA